MTEDFVYEDDPRLQNLHRAWWVPPEDVALLVPGGSGKPVGLLVHSGDSLKLLEVRKRERPKLSLRAGQRWLYQGQTVVLFWDNAKQRLRAIHEQSWTISDMSPCDVPGDPRDHGWTLIE